MDINGRIFVQLYRVSIIYLYYMRGIGGLSVRFRTVGLHTPIIAVSLKVAPFDRNGWHHHSEIATYHQLQGIIRKTYHGVFKGKKIVDNRVSAHAVRLIANCIIAYNSMILNKIYQKMVADGVEKQIIDQFARISPIAWGYILFAGRYSFKKSNGNIDVESMIEILEQQLKKNMFF